MGKRQRGIDRGETQKRRDIVREMEDKTEGTDRREDTEGRHRRRKIGGET